MAQSKRDSINNSLRATLLSTGNVRPAPGREQSAHHQKTSSKEESRALAINARRALMTGVGQKSPSHSH